MIFTVTLNPAIDRILFIDMFRKTQTHRVKRVVETLGGKGTHVSINLKLLGVESTALGVTFGANGKKINSMMRNNGVEVDFLQYDIPGWESRTNVEIVEESDHSCSMFTERGPILPAAITDELAGQIRKLIQPGDYLVLTGDASNVEDEMIYARLSEMAAAAGTRVILDASGKYLVEGIKSKPYLIKPNIEELCFIAGRDLLDREAVVSVIRSVEMAGIEVIAMTWSGNGAIVKIGSEIYQVPSARVNVVNEVGCGDAFLAAMLAGITQGQQPVELLRTASAVAGAAAETEITVGFDLARVETLKKQIEVTRLF